MSSVSQGKCRPLLQVGKTALWQDGYEGGTSRSGEGPQALSVNAYGSVKDYRSLRATLQAGNGQCERNADASPLWAHPYTQVPRQKST